MREIVVRIPRELEGIIEGAVNSSGSGNEESFLLFGALFYAELVMEGQIMAYEQAKHLEFIRLSAAGWSLRKIEGRLGISHGCAVAWKRKYSGRICELSNGEMDQVLEAWGKVRNQRIAELAQRIQSVEVELDNRDLSEIPTKDLMRLDIRYREELRAEVVPRELSVNLQTGLESYMAIIAQCAEFGEDSGLTEPGA